MSRKSARSRRRGADAQSLLSFFVRSGQLKAERRRGWVKKLGISSAESVADHSFLTALMAMVLSDSLGLDTGRALRLALLHDLPEAIVGDATPEERSGKSKTRLETKAMEELIQNLPRVLRTKYRAIWKEFVEAKTEEAKLVKQLDKLEMAIQAKEYSRKLRDPESVREFWETARKHVYDRELLGLLGLVEP